MIEKYETKQTQGEKAENNQRSFRETNNFSIIKSLLFEKLLILRTGFFFIEERSNRNYFPR
jgi:hypothetical protein